MTDTAPDEELDKQKPTNSRPSEDPGQPPLDPGASTNPTLPTKTT